MAGPYNPGASGIQQLHNAATTGNGGILLPRGINRNATIVLQSTGTTSGGTVSIEEAFYNSDVGDPSYSGTWSVIQSVAASTFTGGAQLYIHVGDGSMMALRARISSDITGGGTISAWAWAN